MSSPPPILPITNPNLQPTPPTTAPDVASADATSRPQLQAFVTHIRESVRHGVSQCRPWSELLNHHAFSKPESLSDVASRVRKNASYFQLNYVAVIAAILAFSLVFNPLSLLAVAALLASWLFLFLLRRPSDGPLVVCSYTFSDTQRLGFLVMISIVVVFLTNVGSVVLSALLVGVGIVCAHGVFRVPDDLFLDDQATSSNSFLFSTVR